MSLRAAMRIIYSWSYSSGSSQVNDDSLNNLSSPHEISRGNPSTHVIKWCGSPATGNRGNGQKRAATDFGSTLAGHLNPTTAAIS